MEHKVIKNAKELNKVAKKDMVESYGAGFKVISARSGAAYYVALRKKDGVINGGVCSCKWGAHRGYMDDRSACHHVQAVFEYLAKQEGKTTAAHTSEESAKKARRPKQIMGDGVILTLRKKVV